MELLSSASECVGTRVRAEAIELGIQRPSSQMALHEDYKGFGLHRVTLNPSPALCWDPVWARRTGIQNPMPRQPSPHARHQPTQCASATLGLFPEPFFGLKGPSS